MFIPSSLKFVTCADALKSVILPHMIEVKMKNNLAPVRDPDKPPEENPALPSATILLRLGEPLYRDMADPRLASFFKPGERYIVEFTQDFFGDARAFPRLEKRYRFSPAEIVLRLLGAGFPMEKMNQEVCSVDFLFTASRTRKRPPMDPGDWDGRDDPDAEPEEWQSRPFRSHGPFAVVWVVWRWFYFSGKKNGPEFGNWSKPAIWDDGSNAEKVSAAAE